MIKIVYFDEDSATDFLTILNGGSLIKELERAKISGHTENASIGAGVKGLFNVLFAKGDIEIRGNVGILNSGEKLMKSTISNTILSDFLDEINKSSTKAESKETDLRDKIVKIKDVSLSAIKNSIAYFQTITPYLAMTDSKLKVNDELDIDLSKMHETFEVGKGYYELIGKNIDSKEKILRFNNKAFRNNYGLVDLLQMNLVFYGVFVGNMSKEKLDFTNLINESEDKVMTSLKEERQSSLEVLQIYDVILAGVEN